MKLTRLTFAAVLLAFLATAVATTAAAGPPGTRRVLKGAGGPGTPDFIGSPRRFLTRRQRGSAGDIALGFVRRHRDRFRLDSGDLAGLELERRYTTRRGLTRLDWAQTYKGIPAFDTGLRATVMDGRLVSVSGPVKPDLAVADTTPRLSAAAAMRRALASVGAGRTVHSRGPARGLRRRALLSTGLAELTLFPEADRTLLAWKVYAFVDSAHVYLTVVDARDGSVLRRVNMVKTARGLVHRNFPGALGSGGTDGLRTFATSPDPWLTEAGRLIGDNVHVYSDQDDNLGYDCGGINCLDFPEPASGDEIPPLSGSDWNYPPGHSFGSSPAGHVCPSAGCTWNGFNSDSNWTTNREQAGTQLFWFVNNFHDFLQADAGIQFDDVSGNFEQTSSGGTGGDPVAAQVDDGAETGSGRPDCDHANNANMLALSESEAPAFRGPKMQMYLWTGRCDSGFRDTNGADDATIVYHEYTHGLSGRLVDPDDTGGLGTTQGGAMGEGWSDWYALDYLVSQGLLTDTATPNQLNLAGYEVPGGLRTQGLDVPVGSGGYTYANLGHVTFSGPEVHDDGEIWGETLWDLRRSLVSHYGLTQGERHARALVTDAMRIGPPAPSFLNMRDAILSANTADKLGDCDRIWAVFAARGMGSGASTTSPEDASPNADFTNPSASRCPHAAPPRPPAPTPPPKPSFKKSKRTIRVSRSGRFTFTFSAGAGLRGRITLKTLRKVRPGKRGRKRIASFVNKTFKVPKSGKVRLKLKLSARNRRILRRYKKLRIKVTVKVRNSANLTRTASVRITLKAPRPRRKHAT